MKQHEQLRIEANPDILMGKPVIVGTRIPAYLILNLLASGYTQERILEAYPGLTLEDIRATLQLPRYLAERCPKP